VAGLAEAFSVLAVFEAVDKMSSQLEKMDASLDKFSETSLKAAEAATASGAKIDESLLQTASGVDAVELADARLAAAQEKLAAATEQQAAAEQALLDTRAAVASEDALAAAADSVAAAQERAAAAATALASAQETLKIYEKEKLDADFVAAATDRVAEAQKSAAAATAELTAAQEQQASLVTSEDAAKAADALTAAQKGTAAATRDVSAAETQQAAVQKAAVLATDEGRAAADAAAASQAALTEKQALAAKGSEAMSSAMKYGAIGVAAVGYESLKAAGNWQNLTEHLVTDAGESQQNLAMVSAGMLKLAADTGTSTTDIANGMYHVESAGYHGAAGLSVLKAAAEGAKVGGADLDTVSKALTGTMNAYNMSGSQATQMMNALIATVGQGDMKMQDLAASLGNVAPVAASAGISFSQVGAAIATMTAQNMSAQQATQDLSHTIGSLQNPNAVAVKEMQALGLNVNAVSKNIGKVGLTGTLDELTQAVARNTQGGSVLISTFNASKQAAANAQQEIKAMPANLQSLANAYLNGSITSKQWATDLQGLSPVQAALMKQFATTADQTQKFNQLLTSGSPAAQTYNAAMSKLLGGTTGLKTALMLTGGRMDTFQASAAKVSEALSKGGTTVDNWDKIQGTFNQKMDRAKASVEAAGISIGQVLLPAATKIASVFADVLGPIASWMAQNQKWVGLIAAVVGGALAAAGAMKAWELATRAWAAIQGTVNALMAVFDAETEANPIGIIVIAIAALVAGLIYAYDHFKTFRDIVNDVGKVAVDVWKGVSSFFVGLWHTITHVFSSAIDTVINVVKHWYPLILGVLSGGILLIPALIFKYWNQISGFVEGIWNDVVNVTTTIWNAISGFFEKWWPLLLVIFAAPIAILIALWNHTHQAIFDFVKTVWNGISDFFTTIWHGISAAAEFVWKQIQKWIVTPIEQAWAELSSIIHTVVGFLATQWATILAGVQYIWGLVKHWLIQPLEDAWHAIVTTVTNITNAINKGLTDALHAVENIGSWFVSIGEDIINGIVSGVENAAGGLFGSLENVAKGALNAAKSFLGINSPSKLFADHVGLGIVEGIAKGVNDNAQLAHTAVRSLSSGLTATAHTAVTSSFTGASGLSALGAGGGAGSVQVTIDLRNAVVSGPAAINQLADKVGAALAKKLPAAGVKTRAI
jgi:TP901 family phage tail tape measure protein